MDGSACDLQMTSLLDGEFGEERASSIDIALLGEASTLKSWVW